MRRKLHNAVQELKGMRTKKIFFVFKKNDNIRNKGNIRVFCRVRPVLPIDKEADQWYLN
jgi:hypothetical protein